MCFVGDALKTGLQRLVAATAVRPELWPADGLLRQPSSARAPGRPYASRQPRNQSLRWAANRSLPERHLWDMTSLTSSAASTPSPGWVASAVESAVAGDEVAFARIVSTYHGDLVRVAYVVAGDGQLAEDAAQAAWSIAWRKLGSLRDPERLRPWLVSVAANEARQLLRSRHRRQIAEIRVRPPDDTGSDPSELVERLDLVEAFRHLKPEDRSLLALRFVAGLDAAEIAAVLGMTPSGVRGHLSRLLGRLRKELRDG
jgi:RNA polymerase sigma factor (sigma-70 family)